MNVLLFLPSNPLAKVDPSLSTINWFEREGLIPIKSTSTAHTITSCDEGFALHHLQT